MQNIFQTSLSGFGRKNESYTDDLPFQYDIEYKHEINLEYTYFDISKEPFFSPRPCSINKINMNLLETYIRKETQKIIK